MDELESRSYSRGVYVYSPFLTPTEQSEASGRFKSVSFYGGADFAERKIAVFGSEESLGYCEKPPISLLFVKTEGVKFSSELSHRDYLGSILNLGIERERIGDIFINKEGAYIVADEKVSDLIKRELVRVGKTSVKVEEVEEIPEDFRPKTTEKKISANSCRLDAILCRAYDLSRETGSSLCEKGFVAVNGKQTINGAKFLKEGDVVTARGYGKLVFNGDDGKSKKGKTFFNVLIYK